MSEALPWLFVFVAAIAGILGFLALWLSLRVALSDPSLEQESEAFGYEARRSLLTEKEALLEELRDISFEHDAGKLSDRDYNELNAKLRGRARRILMELDADAGTYRDEAEALIAERLAKREPGDVAEGRH